MGFLNPVFLAAAAALGVPLLLHLLHRHRSRQVVFPALRYLLRTEREHARRIRLRQWLLLLLRLAIVAALVLAGARLYVRGSGDAHPPTALVIVLDNSMSSGRVLDDRRVLDALKDRALEALAVARPADRVWLVRAGEPWSVVAPTSPAEARDRVLETTPSDARADLGAALVRAWGLADASELPAREVHLLSDLQASAFGTGTLDNPGVPTLVFAGLAEAAANRFVRVPQAGGGLPPLADRRFDVVVEAGGSATDTASIGVRVMLQGEVRGATVLRPGESAVLPVGPFAEGAVSGVVESDPDHLAGDDRRHMVFEVGPPPRVRVVGDPGPFVTQALAVLEGAGRLVPASGEDADVSVAVDGQGLGSAERSIVIPPRDPTLLPSLNRRLGEAGVPWRYAEPVGETGEVRVGTTSVPVELGGVRVRRAYDLGDPGTALQGGGGVVATLSDGRPFLVSVTSRGGNVLLVASPLDDEASTLPVDAAMVPLLEWMFSGWDRERGGGSILTGDTLGLPASATGVVTPSGTRFPADGSRQFTQTGEAGVYSVLAGDSTIARFAANTPESESDLTPIDPRRLRASIGSEVRVVERAQQWPREVFVDRQGRELWRPLLLAALLLLLLEGWLAASGGGGAHAPARANRTPGPTPTDRDV